MNNKFFFVSPLILLLIGCGVSNNKLKVTDDQIEVPTRDSMVTLPVKINLDSLSALANSQIPTTLIEVNQNIDACIPKKQAKVCLSPNMGCSKKLKWPGGWTCISWKQTGCGKWGKTDISPQIDCRVEGKATRGPFVVKGEGNQLVVSAPVQLRFKANERGEIGKLVPVKFIADANIFVNSDLDIASDWTVQANPDIHYGWTKPPRLRIGVIDFDIEEIADDEIKDRKEAVLDQIDAEISKLDVRTGAQTLWQQAYEPISLSKDDGNLWLSVSPKEVGFSGVTYSEKEAFFKLMFQGETRLSFDGKPPSKGDTKPLPALTKDLGDEGFHVYVPIQLAFDELQSQIQAELGKNNQFTVQDDNLGNGLLTIKKIRIHQTSEQALAIVVQLNLKMDSDWISTKGLIWATAKPILNKENRLVSVSELDYGADTDNAKVNALMRILRTGVIRDQIASMLNFDYGAEIDKQLAGVLTETATFDLAEGLVGSLKLTNAELDHAQVSGDGILVGVNVSGNLGVSYP